MMRKMGHLGISRRVNIIPLLIVICFIAHNAHAEYGGGTGEPNDPYLIYTAEQMNTIGTEPNDWDKHFKLMQDLDLDGMRVNPIGYWAQIDEEDDVPFSGVFDGNEKSIANFHYTYPGNVGSNPFSAGLFLYVSGMNAEIRNLTLIDPNINAGSFGGSLIGLLHEGSVINCTVTGSYVNGSSHLGGLIGIVMYGNVENCAILDSQVNGRRNIGGLIGIVRDESFIKNCISSASIIGQENIGGLAGRCSNFSVVTNCGATGAIQGTGDYIGGLIGNCEYGLIGGSFASGDVTGINCVGGLVGVVIESSQIICCYATGSVSGNNEIGGLSGWAIGPLFIDSYATGPVNGTGKDVDGLIGVVSTTTTVFDCFWDMETTGLSTRNCGTGLTTLQMHDQNTFISAGWDFSGESANGPSDIWIVPDSGEYPILSWQVSPSLPLPVFSG